MGYDIYIQGRDGKPLPGSENYQRFSFFDMPSVLDAMFSFGMTTEVALPTFPPLADFGLTREDFRNRTESDPKVKERIAAYDAAYRATLDIAEPEPAGIPECKLKYNDGFLVTVAEIAAALNRYDAHPGVDNAESPVGDPSWRNWTALLRRARTYGGLRTH
ncbi:hypothetical protein ACWFR1_22925 [Streptomyces sp. NPDC055103]